MSPILITLAGQKGGVGKTNVAIALAVEWHCRGLRVLVIDADEASQRSASIWSEVAAERGHDAPPVVRVGDDLRAQLHRIAAGYDVVIVDTPGHLRGRVAYALGQSDLILCPCNASGVEVWAMSTATAPGVRDVLAVSGRDAAIVITRQRVDTAAGQRLVRTLGGTGLDVLATNLERRKEYEQAFTIGKGPTNYRPRSKAADEIRALAAEIERRIPAFGKRTARGTKARTAAGSAADARTSRGAVRARSGGADRPRHDRVSRTRAK